MTRTRPSRRLLVAVVGTLVTLLALGPASSVTAASWADRAAFRATASAGTWAPAESCEVLQGSTVVGTCSIGAVRVVQEWSNAPVGEVPHDGSVVVEVDVVASQSGRVRVVVDLSRVQGTAYRWDWTAGTVTSWSGAVRSWAPPVVEIETYNPVDRVAVTFTAHG